MNRTLLCSVVGAAVVALDGTVLTIVRPALRRDLHAHVGQVQWTSTGCLVAVAGLLVFAGRLGDHYGHARVFALGAFGFAVTSTGMALAPDVGAVTAWRVLQGGCGALLPPARPRSVVVPHFSEPDSPRSWAPRPPSSCTTPPRPVRVSPAASNRPR
ncbi:MFS transporter [Streptomyces sp. NPDC058872]|uniref:MFS transporter n=1 Tax=Streptomyces sp. NPDC058872 TaxID=3346661 RepID=UPI00368D1762